MLKRSLLAGLVIVFAAAIGLAGCGQSNSGNNSASNPESTPSQPASSAPAESNKQEKVKITYSTWGSAEEKATEEAVIAEFEKLNPNIDVELILVDGSYEEKLQVMIAGNTTPDVVSIGGAHVGNFSGAFQPFAADEVAADKYLTDILLTGLQSDGEQFALPKRVNTKVIAYNKDLLAKANVEAPGDSFSIEQFQEKAIAVAALGGEGKDKIWGSDPLWFGQWLFQFGGQRVSDDYSESLINSSESKAAVQFIIDAANKYHYAPNPTEAQGQNMIDWFLSGQVGFKGDFGPFYLPLMKQITKFDWDIAPQPGHGGEMEIVGIAVSKTTKHAEAAKQFASFVSSSSEAQKIIGGGAALPVTKEGKEVFLNQFPDKNLNEFFAAMEYSKPQPRLKKGRQMGSLINKALADRTLIGATGQEDPSVVLDELKVEIDELLK
ncbi:ABC transporter substrate-binding protein [Cohnella cellulosilytica]|uniref:ABC transporter substrate-binding protein n=1 Tax=Cohnella cellulosilytica TaxID=986710 RepID=A0ABW2FFJ3_9BACL